MTLKEPTRPRSPSGEPPACDAAAAFIPVDGIERCQAAKGGAASKSGVRRSIPMWRPLRSAIVIGDAVAEEAGSTLRPERDRDDGWECLVAGELPRAALRLGHRRRRRAWDLHYERRARSEREAMRFGPRALVVYSAGDD